MRAVTLVIAEPGCTAEGDYATYIRLIHTAAACGADVWKPQWVSDPVQMCERRHIGVDHPKRAYYQQAYGWLAFPLDWHERFQALCSELGMQYACTVFLPQDVWTMYPHVDLFKVSSFEANDWALVGTCQATGKRTLVSTGMMDGWQGLTSDQLHCVSSYPAPIEALNLSVIRRYGMAGYSDHSRNVIVGALAVAHGATVVEAHYRLVDCDPKNPDYGTALSPHEFTEYIANIRIAERAGGDSEKCIQPCEQEMVKYRVSA